MDEYKYEYESLTLEECEMIYRIFDTECICDGDHKEITINKIIESRW